MRFRSKLETNMVQALTILSALQLFSEGVPGAEGSGEPYGISRGVVEGAARAGSALNPQQRTRELDLIPGVPALNQVTATSAPSPQQPQLFGSSNNIGLNEGLLSTQGEAQKTEIPPCMNGRGVLRFERLADVRRAPSSSDSDVVRLSEIPAEVLFKCQNYCLKDETSSQGRKQLCGSLDFVPGKRFSTYTPTVEYTESKCFLAMPDEIPSQPPKYENAKDYYHYREVCYAGNGNDQSAAATDCPERLYVMERQMGKRFMPTGVKEHNANSLEECETLCLNQATDDPLMATSICRSGTFDHQRARCYLSTFTKRTHSNDMVDDPIYDYFENTCLDVERRCPKNKLFWTKEVNAEMTGPYDFLILQNMTLDDCKMKCLANKNIFCRSIEFDDRSKTCVLSDEDSISRPEHVRQSASDQNIYLELTCIDGHHVEVSNHLGSGEQQAQDRQPLSDRNLREVQTAFQLFRNRRLELSPGFKERGREGNRVSLAECLDACLEEQSFQCRSVIYSERQKSCRLSEFDQLNGNLAFDPDFHYFENLMSGSSRAESSFQGSRVSSFDNAGRFKPASFDQSGGSFAGSGFGSSGTRGNGHESTNRFGGLDNRFGSADNRFDSDGGSGGTFSSGSGAGFSGGVSGAFDRGVSGGLDRGVSGGLDRGGSGGFDRGGSGGFDRGGSGGFDRGGSGLSSGAAGGFSSGAAGSFGNRGSGFNDDNRLNRGGSQEDRFNNVFTRFHEDNLGGVGGGSRVSNENRIGSGGGGSTRFTGVDRFAGGVSGSADGVGFSSGAAGGPFKKRFGGGTDSRFSGGSFGGGSLDTAAGSSTGLGFAAASGLGPSSASFGSSSFQQFGGAFDAAGFGRPGFIGGASQGNTIVDEISEVSQQCHPDGSMEFMLRTADSFRGRIYTFGYYDRCFYRGGGSTSNLLKISPPRGFPDCGTSKYGDTTTNIVVVQFADGVMTSMDKRYNLTCTTVGPGDTVVTSSYIGAGLAAPTPIEYLPEESRLDSQVRLHILYSGRPTTTVAVGDPLTFRIESLAGRGLISDIFATNVVARDPLTGRAIELIDGRGCPVQDQVFPALGKARSGDGLETKFSAFKIPESNMLVFEARVRMCRRECEPASCNVGRGRSEIYSYGRRRRRNTDEEVDDDLESNSTAAAPPAPVLKHPYNSRYENDNEYDAEERDEEDEVARVNEVIRVYLNEDEAQEFRDVEAASLTDGVCISPSEYYSLLSALFILVLCLLGSIFIMGFCYRKQRNISEKNAVADASNPRQKSRSAFPGTHPRTITQPARQVYFPTREDVGPSSDVSMNGPRGNRFLDPSEPIYTDPALFER